jgi:hypothetical protein
LDTPYDPASLTSGEPPTSIRSLTTSAELEAIIQKVVVLREYIAEQVKFEAKVRDMIGVPPDSSRLELDIVLNNAKQKRLEEELQRVLEQH